MIERYRLALELREQGKTFREVGASLDPPVSVERARQMVAKAKRQRKRDTLPDEWTDGLSVRAANVLKAHGFSSKEQIIDAVDSGALCLKKNGSYYALFMGDHQVHNAGRGVAKEVAEWIGRPELAKANAKNPSASSIKAAISLLENQGYRVIPPT